MSGRLFLLHHAEGGSGNCRKQAWLSKNSLQGISTMKFVRKLLNARSPQALKFAEITGLVPFSTPTGVITH